MRAPILSVLISVTSTACITGDNTLEDQPDDQAEAEAIVDVDDLPPLAHEPTQTSVDRLDALDTVLDVMLVRARPLPHKVEPGSSSLPLGD